MRRLSTAAFLTLAACGFLPEGDGLTGDEPDPVAACEAYLEAIRDCFEDFDTGSATSLDETVCDEYADLEAEEAEEAQELLDCYTEAFTGVNCSTPEAIGDASTAASDCG